MTSGRRHEGESRSGRKVAVVIPDGLSAVLFCTGLVKAILAGERNEAVVICDPGERRPEIEAMGARVVALPMERFFDPIADARYGARLWRIFERERFDAVLNCSTKPFIYGSMAARAARVPLVVGHVLGRGSAFIESTDLKQRIVRAMVGRLYRIAASCCDRVWFTNRNDLEYFQQRGMIDGRKAFLTRNYLDVDTYSADRVSPDQVQALRDELGIGPTDPVVLMIARLNWAKGIREFAEAAEQLGARHSAAWFLLLAPPEEGGPGAVPIPYVRDRRGRFRWLGFRRDVPSVIALSDVAVLPSYYREGGYPRGLLEPMAMGKPVIAADTVDCRGPVDPGKSGLLVPPRDSAALAGAIDRLLSDATMRREFGLEGRRRAEELFDEAVIVPQALRELGVISAMNLSVGDRMAPAGAIEPRI